MVSPVTVVGIGVAVLLVAAFIAYTVMIYNGLVRLRKEINRAWSNIRVLLKQRNEEIPNLVDTAEQYMDYEEELMKDITEARNRSQQASGPEEQAEAEQMMRNALGSFFAVAEEYPDLKTTESFQKIQTRVSELETNISDRRELYNQAVNTYNIRINQIPYNFMARLMGYTEKELFQTEEEEITQVDISEEFDR